MPALRSLGTTSLLALTLLAFAACGSSQSSARPAEHAPTAQAAPAAPPIPQDPLELVPSDVAFLAHARVEYIRERGAFASLRRSVLRYGCISEADFDWLRQQTDRALLVGRGSEQQPELLLVLAGHFSEGDSARVLQMLARRAGAAGADAARKQGRFDVAQKGPWSASVLEGRLLLAGHDAFVSSTLDALDHPGAAAYAQTDIFRQLGDHVQCIERSVCALITPDAAAAQRMRGELDAVGMKKVGRELASVQSGLTLAVGDGINLNVVANTRGPEEAEALAKQTRDWLWQAGLVARLAGFPDILGDAQVNTDGAFAELKLRVGESDLARLEQRLTQMLGDEPRCPESVGAQPIGAPPRARLLAATGRP